MSQADSQNKNSYKLYRRLLWEVRHLWPLLVISIIGSIVYSGANSYAMYLLKPLLNEGFTSSGITHQSGAVLRYLAIVLVFLFVLRGLGSYFSSYYMGKLGARVVFSFRQRIFGRFLDLPASYYDKSSSGKLLSRLLYNVDQVTNATGSAIITVFQDGTFVIGLLCVMFFVSWQLSISILVVGPFLALFIVWLSRRFRNISRQTQRAMGDVTHMAEEALNSYKEIRIFGGQKIQQERFDKNLQYTYRQQVKIMFLDGISSPIIQFFGAIILGTILFIVSFVGVKDGGWLDAGGFVAFFAAMMAILKPIKNLTSVNATIQKAVAATEDIFDLLDHLPEVDCGTKTLDKVKGEVVVDNVTFAYEGAEAPALNQMSLTVKSGQTVALVGRSGSGKTTLVNILMRFYQQQQGDVKIDGVSTTELTLENLRSHCSMVSQNVNLFDDTVFNNIAFGKKGEATEEEVIQAAKDANAWEFISKLPLGLQTPAGHNGCNFSGGQRQRIAIARALLKDAPILILDEATSALDNESERAVQQALTRLMANRTTFVVAHRLSTVEHADMIVVMDRGRIIEQGNHAELLALDGAYAQLYRHGLEE